MESVSCDGQESLAQDEEFGAVHCQIYNILGLYSWLTLSYIA